MLINLREKVGIENLKNSKVFVDYSQRIDDVYESLEDYNTTKKKIVLIVFDDTIADMVLKLLNYFQEEENLISHLLLNHSLMSKGLKL